MTYQQKLMHNIFIIDGLLMFVPFCDTEEKQNLILQEVRELRFRVTEIEDMTRTEKQRKIKTKIMTIESELNQME